MEDNIIQLNPWDIEPLHGMRNQGHFDELVCEMKENGWHGRPLLVIETQDGYVAWTGSHRIAAAREAKLRAVPCLVVLEADLGPENNARDWHVFDHDRLKIPRETGNERAVHLMWLEERN